MIVNFNHVRRADIGAGRTPDAKSFNGGDIIHPAPFFHFQGSGSDDFIADPDTQPTANTPIGRWPRVYAVGSGKLKNGFRLGSHLKQVFEGPGSCAFDCLPTCFDNHPLFNLEDAGQHRNAFSGGAAGDFDGTQAARTGWSQRGMVAQGGDLNAIGSGNLQNAHPVFSIIFVVIYGNLWHLYSSLKQLQEAVSKLWLTFKGKASMRFKSGAYTLYVSILNRIPTQPLDVRCIFEAVFN
jgi:hypothetical protein